MNSLLLKLNKLYNKYYEKRSINLLPISLDNDPLNMLKRYYFTKINCKIIPGIRFPFLTHPDEIYKRRNKKLCDLELCLLYAYLLDKFLFCIVVYRDRAYTVIKYNDAYYLVYKKYIQYVPDINVLVAYLHHFGKYVVIYKNEDLYEKLKEL